MSLERDHHGIVVRVGAQPERAWLPLVLGMLGVGLAFLAGFGVWGFLVMGFAAIPLWNQLARTVVRISEEYVVVERHLPLGRPEITRVALPTIREIGREPAGLRLEARNLGTVHIFCPPHTASALHEAIREAMQHAPAPQLRRLGRPPEEIEQMRGSTRS